MGFKRVLLSLFSILVLVFLGLALVIHFHQTKLIFYPSPLAQGYKFDPQFEEIFLDVNGKKVHSLLLESKTKNSPGVLLYFHGNAGSLEGWSEVMSEIVERTSWSVWAVDYPGYGKSEGSILSESSLHDSAEALWAKAEERFPKNAKRVIFGRSIGSGVALKLSTEKSADAVILETPYVNLSELARFVMPMVPLFLLRFRFPSDEWILKTKAPILVLHGTEDEVIPFAQGQRLAAMKPGSHFVAIDGGHHNDLAAYEEFWEALRQFLSELK